MQVSIPTVLHSVSAQTEQLHLPSDQGKNKELWTWEQRILYKISLWEG